MFSGQILKLFQALYTWSASRILTAILEFHSPLKRTAFECIHFFRVI